MEITKKRFPATTKMEIQTFLNDKRINGELYAYLQECSRPIEFEKDGKKWIETTVLKSELPVQKKICEKLGLKSDKTLRSHLNYLIETGYVEDKGKTYYLPDREDIFLMIPLETLQYLNDNCKEHILKTYIYLGQRYKYALSKGQTAYEFTLDELGVHTGIKVKNYSRGYEVINNALILLKNSGLIEYCEYFDGKMKKKKLTNFNFQYKK